MEHQPTPDIHKPEAPNAFVKDTAPTSPELKAAIAKGYEPSDLRLKGIFMFVAVLALTLLVSMSVVYGTMMAFAQFSRDKDPMASPVAVQLPPPYAPLQPSKGFYGNEKNDHQSTDYDDMMVMRQTTQEELNAPAGVTAAGRAHMPINAAMDKALALLDTHDVIQPLAGPATPPGTHEDIPAGSYEGHRGDQPTPDKKPGVWTNDMNDLNNQGN
jgi:hypothetical protein